MASHASNDVRISDDRSRRIVSRRNPPLWTSRITGPSAANRPELLPDAAT
jgi:hypothetical protein